MNDNKLLLTHYQNKLVSLLISENRLRSIKVYDEEKTSLVGNIYVGKVQSLAKGIDAAFVEIADKQVCFLPLEDCKNTCFLTPNATSEVERKVKAGDTLLVQVVRDAVKTKQPTVTTNISLAGNLLAVSVGNNKLGISSKINASKKQEIVNYLKEHGMIDEAKKCIPQDFVSDNFLQSEEDSEKTFSKEFPPIGFVIRTNAQSLTDFAPIIQEWKALENTLRNILKVAPYRTAFTCLRKSNEPYLEDLKCYYTGEVDEIVTDSEEVYTAIQTYSTEQKESSGITLPPVRFYQDAYSLDKLYSIKTHIDEALGSRVWLKSGAYLIIEHTEALTVIDVNTGKYEASKNMVSEELFLRINLEAAEEIALQLKLRNLSGIIIVDFINLESEESKSKLMNQLKKLTAKDSVRTNVVDMTPLGLVEITRKRVNRPLRELL